MPIVNEPVTFTLNGSESCTATTDATGTATCDITAGEPSSSYTLTATFPGDTTTSTPIGSNSSTNTFTVNPDTSALTYTGSTSAVNGQPTTLSGTLTTDTPTTGTPLPTKVVTFTVGSGTTAQSCSGTTDVNGDVSCTIATVDQPSGTEPITSTFAGDSYDTPVTTTSSMSVTEPTTLTVNPTTVSYGDTTTVSGTLTDSNLNLPIPNEPVTFTVNAVETCTGTTDSNGLASCTVTPGESTGNYTVNGSFTGDATQPVPLTGSTNSAAFVVTPAVTTLTYTGPNATTNGQPITLSGTLTTESTPLPEPTRDADARIWRLRPDVRRDDRRDRRRELHNPVGQPAARSQPCQRHLSRDEQLPAGQRHEYRPSGAGPGVDHLDGHVRHRDLRHPDHRHRDAGQRLHEHARRRGDRHAQRERDPVLHGNHGCLRCGHLHRHAHRAGRDVQAERLVRGRRDDGTGPVAQHRLDHFRRHQGSDDGDLHREHDHHER